ncbi:variant leucine-rich repeat-containing protein [Subtercola endophyticus]|uniref:variant leucine-rich repeat-containing protein n=1 Tax=Subtercola endophyticus TaxID=2895559 RepID=UPI001E30C49B|nr:hypothetical protein [Subtercola endophyticus]UFS59551.1 hypothetical protein LQ955_01755 [Subtercola endophyticus]
MTNSANGGWRHGDARNASANATAAAYAAADPRTDPRMLADIAYRYPQLRGVLLANPSTYAGLRDWILAQPQPAATWAVPAALRNPIAPPAVAAGASSSPSPQSPKPKGPGASPLAALAIAMGIVVVGVLIVTATVLADGVVKAATGAGTSHTTPSASSGPPAGGSQAGDSQAGNSPAADPYAPAPGEAVFGSAAVSDAFFTPTQAAGFGRAGTATIIRSTVGESSAELTQLWATGAAEPADTTCRFAASTVPVFGDEKSGAATEVVSSVAEAAKLATSSTVSQSARVFSNAEEAGAYISRLQRAVSSCTTVDVGNLRGSMSSDIAGTITPHASWIIDGTFGGAAGKLYVVDMRHDNLVMRTEIFVAEADEAAVSDSVIDGIQDRAEQNLIDVKP